MNLADLKIQLEGKYERAEAEAARWESTASELELIDWTSRRDWRALFSVPIDREALDALEKTARAQHDSPVLPVLARFAQAQLRVHRLLDDALQTLGERASHEHLERKLELFASHLPAAMARTYDLGFPNVVGWLLGRSRPLTIMVTKKVLVVNGKARALGAITRLTVTAKWLGLGYHIALTTNAGDWTFDEWEMDVSPSELLGALAAHRIEIVQG